MISLGKIFGSKEISLHILIVLVWLYLSIYLYTDNFCLLSIIPVTIYANADTQKLEILRENKHKSGVYRWKNNVNGKTYIALRGSVNLGKRLSYYYSLNYLMINNYMLIHKALLKHGYSNFSLEIFKYCKPQATIFREQYYMDFHFPQPGGGHMSIILYLQQVQV